MGDLARTDGGICPFVYPRASGCIIRTIVCFLVLELAELSTGRIPCNNAAASAILGRVVYLYSQRVKTADRPFANDEKRP